MRFPFFLLLTMMSLVTLSGCYLAQTIGENAANRLAAPAFMNKRVISAGAFDLTLYERIHDRGGPADVYIGGDDPEIVYDGMSNSFISLRLATRDKAKNVIFVSRPCQFDAGGNMWKASHKGEGQECDLKYLRRARFAPEVIASYNAVLDDLRDRWGISGFNLYGHSGGGVIAALVASQRHDILSLTTVASMLDHIAYSAYKSSTEEGWAEKYEPLTESLNAADIAVQLRNLPQYHYIGGADNGMPSVALFGYLNRMGLTNCVHYKMIQENGYTSGWVDKWTYLLQDKPVCRGPARPIIFQQ